MTVPYTIVHPETDWDRIFNGPGSSHSKASTLRRDPRQNSITTIHLDDDYGQRTAEGRPTAGQRTFFMGPAQRVVGGQLRWVYPEHVPRSKMSRALDPAEILAQIDEMTSGQSYQQSATDTSRSQPAAEARPRSQGAEGAMQSGSDAFARAAEWSAACRGLSTAPFGTTRKDYRAGANTGARPLVYWRDRVEHVVEPAPGHEGCDVPKEESLGWSLTRDGPAPQATATHTAKTLNGTGALSTAAKTTSRQMYSMSPAALANQSLADSVRTYGSVFKPIGHKEYENTAKEMNGLYCWETTQSHLKASVLVGRPSQQLGPWEHTVTRLTSLRRPATSNLRH